MSIYPPKYFDAHTHTHFAAYDEDREAVINRTLGAGVWMINVGTQNATSQAAIDLAHAYKEGLFATVGLHPIHTGESFHDAQELGGLTPQQKISGGEKFEYDVYRKLAADPKVVGIGECGLDHFRVTDETAKKKQEEVLRGHIELSHETKKPLMIHCRNAFDDLIRALESNKHLLLAEPGVIHFFSGDLEQTKKLLALGFSFTFGGVITFARNYDEVLRYLPAERILTETDAPYVAPVPHRGKRNEPAWVIDSAKKIAEIRGDEHENAAHAFVENAFRVFGISAA